MKRGYINIHGRSIYTALVLPNSDIACEWCALVLQPFGEEKRCSLRTVHRICQRLADHGIPAMTFDYSGTGDSGGRHEDVLLSHWQEEATAAVHELKQLTSATKLHLIALRSGALALGSLPCDKLTLAEPVFTGKEFLRDMERRQLIKSFSGPQDTSQREFAGFLYSEAMLQELSRAEVNPAFSSVTDETRIIHLTGGQTYPPSWKPYLPNATATILRDRPFWGLTDYFESKLPDCFA